MFPWVWKINPAGWFHLLWFGVALPALVTLKWRKAVSPQGQLPNRLRHFQATTVELVMWAVVSLSAARAQRIALFPSTWPSLLAITTGVAILALQLAYMWPRWRRAVLSKSPIVHLFMPANATERAWWLSVSLLAGVGEEITWRGVQWALLANLTGSYLVAALLSSVMFGAAHMRQGWRSSLVIVGFALSFHLLVWVAGSLYVAMAVHVVYDTIAGLRYGHLGRTLGYATKAA